MPYHQSNRLSRDELREIAAATLDALDDGFYYPPASEREESQTEINEERNDEGEARESKKEVQEVRHDTNEEI